MLAQRLPNIKRLRRWLNIKLTLMLCLVLPVRYYFDEVVRCGQCDEVTSGVKIAAGYVTKVIY